MLAAHPAEASAVDKHLVSAKACPAHASAQPRPLPYLPRRTVDLVHLLCDYGVKFRFLTTTIGVNPDYKNEAFYRSTLDADALRVKDLFERAAASGIEIERRSLSDGELCDLTRPPHDSLVMALVDRRYLYRPPPNSVSGFIEGCFSSLGIQGGYVGHYVLLTGFDASRDGYYIKDPAKPSEELFVHSEHLHAARRAHGTDEDLILIPWVQSLPLRARLGNSSGPAAAGG